MFNESAEYRLSLIKRLITPARRAIHINHLFSDFVKKIDTIWEFAKNDAGYDADEPLNYLELLEMLDYSRAIRLLYAISDKNAPRIYPRAYSEFTIDAVITPQARAAYVVKLFYELVEQVEQLCAIVDRKEIDAKHYVELLNELQGLNARIDKIKKCGSYEYN